MNQDWKSVTASAVTMKMLNENEPVQLMQMPRSNSKRRKEVRKNGDLG